ncbi:hypothetical protein CW304_28375 [Bacillus sp. UFRGS-B20]|nr:hypothetical protein CW304_28375 [Bacillus sp. UFRGS-B20]
MNEIYRLAISLAGVLQLFLFFNFLYIKGYLNIFSSSCVLLCKDIIPIARTCCILIIGWVVEKFLMSKSHSLFSTAAFILSVKECFRMRNCNQLFTTFPASILAQ